MRYRMFLHFAQALLTVVLLANTFDAPGSPNGDVRLDVLKTGTQVYSNVTVTTRAKDYIFLQHATGLVSVKVADLDDETRVALEYAPAKKPAVQSTADWAKKEFARLEPAGTNLAKILPPKISSRFISPGSVSPATAQRVLIGAVIMALAAHFFFSYCALRICVNAGAQPGFLIWLPGLQLLPLLSAASMSRWWCLGCLVPLLNLVVGIMWCFKIVHACGKSMVTAILMILPITNLFAFLYLSFSSGKAAATPAKVGRANEIMTLEAA